MQKIGIVIVLAAALFVVPALGIMDDHGNEGIFQSDDTALHFPVMTNVNFDSINAGSDSALAFGPQWGILGGKAPKAENNVAIEKAQSAGSSGISTNDSFVTGFINTTDPVINIEQIKLGNRQALAFGSAVATNNIKIAVAQTGNI